MGYHALVAVSPNAPGNLRNGIGKNKRLSIKWICCIFMLIIFRPFIITSGCHFKTMALFSINCISNPLALWAIATTFDTNGRGSHKYANKSQQDPGRTNVYAFHIARNPHLCLSAATHKSNKTAERKLNWERALLPRPNTAPAASFRNHKRWIKRRHCGATHSLADAYCTCVRPLCSDYSFYRTV